MSKHGKGKQRKNRSGSARTTGRLTLNGITLALPEALDLVTGGRAKINSAIQEHERAGIRRASPKASISPNTQTTGPDEKISRALAAITTNAWRARGKMVDPQTLEPRDEMKRAYRHIESIFDALKELGVTCEDPVGRTYSTGMALKVVSFEPTPGLSREEVKETIKPSIDWNGRLIQLGEVIVGTLVTATSSKE